MDRDTVLGLWRLQALCHPSKRLLQRVCNLIVGQVTLKKLLNRPEALDYSPCNTRAELTELKGLLWLSKAT